MFNHVCVVLLLQELEAPNVMRMVRSFNQLALLVPTEVLSEATPTARAKVIASFIQVIETEDILEGVASGNTSPLITSPLISC